MLTSYHNHTVVSDGNVTLQQHIDAAHKFNLDELGISDHLTLMPNGSQVDWSMSIDQLNPYVDEIKTEAKKNKSAYIALWTRSRFLSRNG